MKKLLLAFMMVFLLASSTSVLSAAPALKVFLNGTEMNFPNKPIVVKGTTMVPFRNLLESLNAKVDFNAATRTITTSANNTTIQLVLGEKIAVKNGEIIQLAQAPYVKDNVTYVPLRFLSQSFGYQVDFNNNKINITTSGGASATSSNKPTLTVEQVGKLADRVAFIELFDSEGDLLGTGSGVVVEGNGGVLTNFHVIDGAAKAIVHINKKQYESKTILKYDMKRDLALIKIEATNLPIVSIGNSSTLALGEAIVTIGSPLGLSNTLSTGNVSSVSRDFLGSNFIQITAPIDYGSSGGALFNMKGELMGITTAAVESSANLNFAIPSNDVGKFLSQPSQPIILDGNYISEVEDEKIANKLQDELNKKFKIISHAKSGLTFDVEWEVVYSTYLNVYGIDAYLTDYNRYVEFVNIISRTSGETAYLSFDILEHIEEFTGSTNVVLGFSIRDSISYTPDYSIVSSDSVSYSNGMYEIEYMFNLVIRGDDEIMYVNHEMFDEEFIYTSMP